MSFLVRKGKIEDVPEILRLVRELAIYEKAEHEVINTVEQLEVDGFGEQPIYGVLIGEDKGVIVGMALYYFRYSTWKGKRIYLEDLIISENFRGFGFGKLLFEATIEEGKKQKCTGMMWQVLDWNEPAIKFYESYKARLDGEWLNCHLEF